LTTLMAGGASKSMSVAELLPGLVSNSEVGLTVAVLVSAPVNPGLIWAITVEVAGPPGSRVTAGPVAPTPLGWGTRGPGEATAVQSGGRKKSAGENRSLTTASTAVLGPALLTTMV